MTQHVVVSACPLPVTGFKLAVCWQKRLINRRRGRTVSDVPTRHQPSHGSTATAMKPVSVSVRFPPEVHQALATAADCQHDPEVLT